MLPIVPQVGEHADPPDVSVQATVGVLVELPAIPANPSVPNS
jgi:hypothetical protein